MPSLSVPGRTFPVQTNYLEDILELTGHCPRGPRRMQAPASDAEGEAVGKAEGGGARQYSDRTREALLHYDDRGIDYDAIAKLVQALVDRGGDKGRYAVAEGGSAAVLVFMPGTAEISKTIRAIHDRVSPRTALVVFLPRLPRSFLFVSIPVRLSSFHRSFPASRAFVAG